MDSFSVCTEPTDLYLLASALKSFFLVIGTHLLAGEVDTTLSDASLINRLSWLLRYFNPVNLSWRYYSILAYRVAAKEWGEKQEALVNSEAHPFRPPVPYIVTEKVEGYQVRRLESSGVFTSQGLLTISAAYQGVLAVYNTISTAGIAFLPNITMGFAVIGLVRVMVFPWIASKIYVEAYAYPFEVEGESDTKSNKWVMMFWICVLGGLLFLSFWPYIGYPAFHLPGQLLLFSVQVFYQYAAVSEVVFHAILLSYGPRAWANRILCFDHWLYKLQTVGFVGLLASLMVLGIADFVSNHFYRSCP